MNAGKQLLRWASGIMLVLGTGHLLLLTVFSREDIAGWVGRGVWAAVPLGLTDSGADQTVASLQNAVTFWAGPGSFAVPLILLGCLTWHLAGRGVAVPAGIGWGLAAWCSVGGVLLVPSRTSQASSPAHSSSWRSGEKTGRGEPTTRETTRRDFAAGAERAASTAGSSPRSGASPASMGPPGKTSIPGPSDCRVG
ncbi:hypothetical protein ACGF5C_22105 [Micromonospora sp. NPDC047620]|uniref:hypothetical protein n=1 Tax=Micromonospora sp. NPDC047620 TaxID=3364251 RepID=UPI00371E8732